MKMLRIITPPAVFILLFLAVSPVDVCSQPRGDEPQVIRRKINELQSRVSKISEKIATGGGKEPQLYVDRGRLYRDIYLSLYGGSYLSNFYGDKPPELSVPALTTKAIADFDQASGLSASLSSEVYQLRAEIYEARWKWFVSGFKWEDERRLLEAPEWRDFFESQPRHKELIVFGKFIGNTDFKSAVSDYEQALRREAEIKTADKIHQEIARLYLERALQISQGLKYNRGFILQKNKYNYRLFDDMERGIRHIEQSHPNDVYRQTYAVESSWFKVEQLTPMYANYFKSRTANDYGKTQTAFEAINKAEKYFLRSTKNVRWDFFGCQLYGLRSLLNSKAGNFDRALADASYVRSEPSEPLCGDLALRKGDAYSGKGEWRKAIAAYTFQLSLNSSSVSAMEIYQKIGKAFLKTGETEKALAAFRNVSGYYLTSLEGYTLEAQAHRLLGDESAAIEDEKAAVNVRQLYDLGARERIIYGKVRISASPAMTVDYRDAELRLIYLDGTNDRWLPRLDPKGRFKLYDIKPKRFYLAAYYETKLNGKTIRYAGRTKPMMIGKRIVGPLVIDLRDVSGEAKFN